MTALCIFLFAAATAASESEEVTAIAAAKIVSAEGPVIDHGILLIRGKKIAALGPRGSVKVPEGARMVDVGDRWLMPGIVEAHTHIGTEGGFNDMVYPLNPDLRMGDCIDFESEDMKLALAEGVTTINTMPGSGTNHSGFSVIVKTAGGGPEERIVRDPGCMKIAQAFNPERETGDMGGTRMGMAYLLRRLLREGKAYADAWRAYEAGKRKEKPPFRRDLERVRMVFEGKVPVINHTYSGWGVAEAIRLFSDEFGLKLIATHTAFGGFQVGEYAAARATKVFVNIGPRLVEYRTPPDGKIHNMASEYWKRGVRNLSINTDSVGFYYVRLSPQQHLFFQATMAARYGLAEQAAMRAITIEPARALSIDDRVGSLKVGKDADVVVKRGSLLDVTSPVDMVFVNGRIAFVREACGITVREPRHGTPRPPTGKGKGCGFERPGSDSQGVDPESPDRDRRESAGRTS